MIFKKVTKRKLFLLFGDIIIIILSINLAFIIRMKKSIITQLGLKKSIMTILLMLIIWLINFYIFDLYNTRLKFNINRVLVNVTGSLILTSFIIIGLFYISPYVIGRGIFLIGLSLIGFFIYVWRLFYSFLFVKLVSKKNVLIIGTGKPAEEIFLLLKENPDYKTIGFISDELTREEDQEMRVLGNSGSIEEIAKKQEIDDIVITVDPTVNRRLNRGLINCKMMGINIYDIATFYEHSEDKLPISFVKEPWILYSNGFSGISSRFYKRSKRVMDLLFSLLFLVCFFPLGLLLALCIKLGSGGPIFFSQERLGIKFIPFKMIKFRTMVVGAEKGKPKWADENDHRVTRVGKILRKSRLDELPQFINVIKGDMSFIGPRPERKHFVKELKEKIPFYSLRFSVKPGITGWAQINYRYGATEEDALKKLQYELYYIKNMSLFLDLRILLKTIRIVLFGMGR